MDQYRVPRKVNRHVYWALCKLSSDSKFVPFEDILKETTHSMRRTNPVENLPDVVRQSLENFTRLQLVEEKDGSYSLFPDSISLIRRACNMGTEEEPEEPPQARAPKRPHEVDEEPSTSENATKKRKTSVKKVEQPVALDDSTVEESGVEEKSEDSEVISEYEATTEGTADSEVITEDSEAISEYETATEGTEAIIEISEAATEDTEVITEDSEAVTEDGNSKDTEATDNFSSEAGESEIPEESSHED